MRKAELRAGPPGREIAATLFLPDGVVEPRPIVMFASPGGGYARGYYDTQPAIKARTDGLGRDSDGDTLLAGREAHREIDFRHPFHWEDVPDDILAADMAGGYPARRIAPTWRSLTVPRCVAAMRSPGYVRAEAAQIDVPVMMAYGERDVSEDPRAEPAAFSNGADITVFIAPRMAHMHNFASTREMFWDRLVRWRREIAP